MAGKFQLLGALMVLAGILARPMAYLVEAYSLVTTYGGIRPALEKHFEHSQIDRSRSRAVQLGQGGDLIGVAVGVIAVGVIVFVGISIMASTREQAAVNESSAFYDPMVEFTTTMGDMFGYIGLAMLAALASVIIGYLVAFRGTATR